MKSVPQSRRTKMPPPPPEEEFEDDESDEEFEDDDFDEEDDEEGEEELAELMEAYLSHEDDNVCSAMLKVAKQLETTNRLLVKMLTLQQGASQSPKREKLRQRRQRVVEESGSSEGEGEGEGETVDLTEETEA